MSPYHFALCCYKIYQLTEKKLITSDYISSHLSSHLESLDKEASLTQVHLKELFELHTAHYAPTHPANDSKFKFTSNKNEKLRRQLEQYALDNSFFREAHAECAAVLCDKMAPVVRNQLSDLLKDLKLGEDWVFAPSKGANRIKQKYNEYAASYLQPSAAVYKRFKDLFRASISFEAYKRLLISDHRIPLKFIAEINQRVDGNYRACYVILNIDTLNVELKVVESLRDDAESHQWYELRRNNSIENLVEFLRRGLPDYLSVSFK